MKHTGVITNSQRTTLGALAEIVLCGIIASGVAFICLLIIAACGGLHLLAEVAR